MTAETPLDRAWAEMAAAPEDDAARLGFYARLADAELFLLLSAEPDGATLDPETFAVEGGPVVLAFDREDRLGAFVGRPAPYAALSGRNVAAMLAGQGLGLGVNLGATSEILIPAAAVDWLAATLGARPAEVRARPTEVAPPAGLPEALFAALDAKLGAAAGLARTAYLVRVGYGDGERGHLLAFVDAAGGAEDALARAAGEALTFSGLAAGALDIGFLAASDPMAGRLAKVGLRFDLPEVEANPDGQPVGPGMDPERPPKLR